MTIARSCSPENHERSQTLVPACVTIVCVGPRLIMTSVAPFGRMRSRNGLRRPSTSQYSWTMPASAPSGGALEYRHRPGEDSYSNVRTGPGMPSRR